MADTRLSAMKHTAKDLFTVWSSGEIMNAAAFVTEDFLLCDHAFNRRHQGLPAVRDFFAETSDIIRLEFELIRLFPDEMTDTLAAQWVLIAHILKPGLSVSAPGVSTLQFRGERVCEERDHYSATEVLKVLFKHHPMRVLAMAKRDFFS